MARMAKVLRAIVRNDAMKEDPEQIYNGRVLGVAGKVLPDEELAVPVGRAVELSAAPEARAVVKGRLHGRDDLVEVDEVDVYVGEELRTHEAEASLADFFSENLNHDLFVKETSVM
ncbi:hypothetical protein NLG97_g5108 [Lecanicillium saksenae]|uniref:Uncharacterized protein n=1 Tax=Lecanicillium saksenae TaxID=468837 RepID=A0ACC1QUP9_9HYPO|nr:hypothetical protein NLG97_g5108 [Lecanicillium saksenae]